MKRRFIILFALGFSSGLPFSLVGSTLQAWFSSSAVNIVIVGMLGLIAQPYSFKFLWAPLMDRFSPWNLGRRRGWILLTQTGLVFLLFSLSFLNPADNLIVIIIIAAAAVFLSASQDIAIDAYRTELLLPEERGLGNAAATAGYRIALLVSGGAALIMAQYYGWKLTYQCMSLLMFIGILANLLGPSTDAAAPNEKDKDISLLSSLTAFFRQDAALGLLIFIFLYKLAEAFTSMSSTLSAPFLIEGMGFDLATVGAVNKMGGVIAAIAGTFIAGILMLRLSLLRSLVWFGIIQSISVLTFVLLAFVGKDHVMLTIAVVMDNLAAGMSTTALMALIMSMCQHRYTATHFAFMTAVALTPRMIAGPVGTIIQGYIGWTALYSCVFILGWSWLILLKYLVEPVKAFSLSREWN